MSSSDSDNDTLPDTSGNSSSTSSDDTSHDGYDTEDAVDDADGDFNDIEGALRDNDGESRIFPRYDPIEDNYNGEFDGDDGVEAFARGSNPHSNAPENADSENVDNVPKHIAGESSQPDSLRQASLIATAEHGGPSASNDGNLYPIYEDEADDEHENIQPLLGGEISESTTVGSNRPISAKGKERLKRTIKPKPNLLERIRALELQIQADVSDTIPEITRSLSGDRSTSHDWIQRSTWQQGFIGSIYSWLPSKYFSKPEYPPLPGSSYIRVLVLYPGEDAEDLAGRLDVVDLENTDTQYEAISYQSGGRLDVSSDPIILSGRVVFFSTTLTDFLMDLRLRNRNRVLWADALCINQADHAERMQQVGMMQQIYSRAHRVLVCLGAENPIATDYFPAVGALASAWLQFQKKSGLEHGSGEPPASIYKGVDMNKIASIFDNSYWTRLWVVQEVVSSRRAMVHWGNEEISWTLLGLAAVLIRNNGTLWARFTSLHKPLAITGLMNAYLIYQLPSAESGSNSMSFLDLLRLTRNFEVAIPLDRIYAILGLPSQHTGERQDFIQPDYRLLKQGLYTRVFHRVLATHKIPLEILSAVRHTTLFHPDFPTWVPQWRLDPTRSIGGSHREGMKFDASAGGPVKPLIKVIWKLDQRSLTVEGFTIGKVISSHDILPKSSSESSTERKIEMKKQGKDVVSWAQKHLEEHDLVSKLALALTAGLDWYGAIVRDQAATERHVRCFLQWARRQHWKTSPMYWKQSPQPGDSIRQYSQAVHNVSRGRKLFAATEDIIGLGPNLARPDDVVCVILGGPVPYILRPLGKGQYYFVGECYVPGYMFGETIARAKNERWEPDRFVLK